MTLERCFILRSRAACGRNGVARSPNSRLVGGRPIDVIDRILKSVTKTVADIGDAVINGVTDVVEAVTGENPVTGTVRRTGHEIVRGAQELADGLVDLGKRIVTGESDGDGSGASRRGAQPSGGSDTPGRDGG
ncbi:MAG TPA: hypothetical protein VF234_06995 [Limnochordia bacterium]